MANRVCKDNTGAVIVAFNPEAILADYVRALHLQVASILVIDNSPSHAPWLTELAAKLHFEVLGDGVNHGVGWALNRGVEWAKSRGLDWLLTFDQDTLVYDSLLDTLGAVVDSREDSDSLAIIGGNYVENHRGEAFWQCDSSTEGGSLEVPWVITSGSLLSLAATETIGPFREDWFIDLIDTEYCLRARSKGFKVLLTMTPLMEHTVGEPQFCRILGRRLTTPNHSASRHYYAARNHLLLLRQYRRREPEAMSSITSARRKETVLMLLCEKGRSAKLWSTLKGVMDGLLGKTGFAR